MLKEKQNVLAQFPKATSQKRVTDYGYGYVIIDGASGNDLSDLTYSRDMAWKHASDSLKGLECVPPQISFN